MHPSIADTSMPLDATIPDEVSTRAMMLDTRSYIRCWYRTILYRMTQLQLIGNGARNEDGAIHALYRWILVAPSSYKNMFFEWNTTIEIEQRCEEIFEPA
ncbi:hypothetical protein O9929_15795 [Vibrio lentus]|nr:hypothetical protein [Vibrio lentus]